MGKNNPEMTTISITRTCKAELERRRITKYGKMSFSFIIGEMMKATPELAKR